MTSATDGVPRPRPTSVDRAIASDCPRSSAPRPGEGPDHAEIVLQPGFGVVTLFLGEHGHGLAAKPADPGNQRVVFGELAVAGQRREILDQTGDIRDRVRPVRVPGHQRLLPGCQLGVEVLQRLRGLRFQALDFAVDVDGLTIFRGQRPQFLDLAFNVCDGLFEVQIAVHLLGYLKHAGPAVWTEDAREDCRAGFEPA